MSPSIVSADDGTSCGTSIASSAFGCVEFKTGKQASASSKAAISTDYETFIDYGDESVDCTKQIFAEAIKPSNPYKSSLLINRDSDGSFVFPSHRSGSKCFTIESRDSLPIHSNPIRFVAGSSATASPSRDSVVMHTSTARLRIGGGSCSAAKIKQQISDVSQISGFDKRITGAHMACEDLVNIDDSIRLNGQLLRRPIVEDRHSMPTLFVGNRFNSSDVTEVYIPSYKDKKDVQLTTITTTSGGCQRTATAKYRSRESSSASDDSTSTTTHSSSIDLPAVVMPAPDQITAELLYNFYDQCGGGGGGSIIKPPSMFVGGVGASDLSRRISLSRDQSPFNKHSLNSDKRLAATKVLKKQSPPTTVTRPVVAPATTTTTTDPHQQRCVSYQFVKLNYPGGKTTTTKKINDESAFDETTDDFASKKCDCCASSRCPSPRSNDSGMAGSCTIASPDPPTKSDDVYSSPFDNEFDEHFDGNDASTAAARRRTSKIRSGLRHSSSTHNFGRFDVVSFTDDGCGVGGAKEHNHDSGQYGDSASLTREENDEADRVARAVAAEEADEELRNGGAHRLSVARMQNMFELSTSRDTVRREPRCQSAERLLENTPSSHNDRRYVMEIGGGGGGGGDKTGHATDGGGGGGGGIYKTGMYAHWWKKETLPGAMLKDLIVMKYNRQRHAAVAAAAAAVTTDATTTTTTTTSSSLSTSSDDSFCGGVGVNIGGSGGSSRFVGWGSGKNT